MHYHLRGPEGAVETICEKGRGIQQTSMDLEIVYA